MLSEHSLSSVPSTVLSTDDTAQNKADKTPSPHGPYFLVGEIDNK